ncbi:hypothetical protein CMUST_01105 [Corynebacterium mustelae]|uniref:Uncharacterized protein n=1 Tax=Corynebacterium mustelae TaxID=571915 RepID=A0A0G3GTS0_9CORY|nr:hypothetical protein [Corynebacterium mustelae]AKK04571.1 hypothetical protein CMUST_01105 [Corynebacterium mustelae]
MSADREWMAKEIARRSRRVLLPEQLGAVDAEQIMNALDDEGYMDLREVPAHVLEDKIRESV